MRDAQRQRLYEAESAALHVVGPGVRYASLEACQAFVERVLRPCHWRRLQPRLLTGWRSAPRVVVRRGRAGCSAHAMGTILWLPPWAWNRAVILHELAHTLTPGREPAHGRLFAHNLLVLVRRWMGPPAARALRQAFREHRVHHRPRRRHVVWVVLRAERRAAAKLLTPAGPRP